VTMVSLSLFVKMEVLSLIHACSANNKEVNVKLRKLQQHDNGEPVQLCFLLVPGNTESDSQLSG